MIRDNPSMSSNAPREVRWCLTANRWARHRRVHRGFAIVSRLGDGAIWYTLIALLPLLDGARGAMASVHLAVVGVIAVTLYRWLKRWTRRPRPFASHRDIVAWVAPLDEFSFPSGHTLHAVSFTIVACWWYLPLAVVLVPFTVAVALSRVVLGLHYPSDVIAATAIGMSLASAAIGAGEWLGWSA